MNNPVNEICNNHFTVSEITEMVIWSDLEFHEIQKELHIKLREDVIPVSELRFIYTEWRRNPDALLGSLGF